jgi:hypothetical protein
MNFNMNMNKDLKVALLAGVLFVVLAHPETFKFVANLCQCSPKGNTILLIHGAVMAVLVYQCCSFFGLLREGMSNKKKRQ